MRSWAILAVTFFIGMVPAVQGQSDNNEAQKPAMPRMKRMLHSALEQGSLLNVTLDTPEQTQKKYILMPVAQFNRFYYRCVGVPISDTSMLIDFIFIMNQPFEEPQQYRNNVWYTSSFDGVLALPVFSDIVSMSPYKDEVLQTSLINHIDDIRKRRAQLMHAFMPGHPVRLIFSDGTDVSGIIDTVNREALTTMLTINQQEIGGYEQYTEYTVKHLEGIPHIRDGLSARLPVGAQWEIKRLGMPGIIPKEGIFTNKTVWMGRMPQPQVEAFYQAWRALENYQVLSLFSMTVYDLQNQPHTFYLGDIAALQNIEPIDDPVERQRYAPVYLQLTEVPRTLEHIWVEKPDSPLYVEFKNRPVARGNLVEYVPPYTYGVIAHAVIEDTNGKRVVIRREKEIERIHMGYQLTEMQKEEFDTAVAANRSHDGARTATIKTPETGFDAVTLAPRTGMPALVEMTVDELSLYSATPAIPGFDQQLVLGGPDEAVLYMKATVTATGSEDRPVWLFYDDFTMYERDGSPVMYQAFISNGLLTDVLAVSGEPQVIEMLFVVDNTADELYLHALTMEPLAIKRPDRAEQTGSSAGADTAP